MEKPARLIADVGLDEIKVILGYLFNFRRMTVSLSEKKGCVVVRWTT